MPKDKTIHPMKPAINSEDREKQLVSMAMDAAQKQFENGTASNQMIVHLLKLDSEREKTERAMLEAKAAAIRQSSKGDEQMQAALDAFRGYRPKGKNDQEEE